ncbi:MAG: hypothetical protein K1X78_01835 [Verrucomicrobiaceae bacterium]|nr:hypothetical protein [Verrucomicrobiaceae bacterium]
MKHQARKASRDERRETDLDALLARQTPSFRCFHIEEPRLMFGGGNTAVDPKAGITAFGPLHSDPHTARSIRVGVIGTGNGIHGLKTYVERCLSAVEPGLNRRQKHYDPLCFPDFPGACPAVGFRTNFSIERERDIPLKLFEHAASSGDPASRLRAVVELVDKQLEMMSALSPRPEVVIVVLPRCVEDACRTIGSRYRSRKQQLTQSERAQRSMDREAAKQNQFMLPLEFTEVSKVEHKGFWNIHHALKAHAMKHGMPTQLAWESTLSGEGLTQDPATMAWNFFTALYYKADNVPWQLEHLTENTCYVGIAFYRSDPQSNALQSSLAQAFSGHGEGLVLQGPKSILDRRGNPIPHLSEHEAEHLLAEVLKLYEDFHHVSPRRVVVHKSSRFLPDELVGFKRALTKVDRHDFVAINSHHDRRLLRIGKEPPVRGTAVQLSEGRYLLYTVGYVPALRDYPGAHVPVPLEILEHHGDSGPDIVCQEILALTKLNWNSCNFACAEPITLQFARSVGSIIRELPKGSKPSRLYRYYM